MGCKSIISWYEAKQHIFLYDAEGGNYRNKICHNTVEVSVILQVLQERDNKTSAAQQEVKLYQRSAHAPRLSTI